MSITDTRKSEIESIIDTVLGPYSRNLDDFRLEDIREQYRILLIGTTRRIPIDGKSSVFIVVDDYVIAFHKDIEITPNLMAHELGHIVLEHLGVRKRYFESLSGYQKWERYVVRKEEPPFPWGDTPQERIEANYFSEYWCKRLQDINWLKGLEIRDLDNLKRK